MAKGPFNNAYEEARKQRLEENMRRFQVYPLIITLNSSFRLVNIWGIGRSKFANSLKEEVIKIKNKPKAYVKANITPINSGPLRRSARPRNEVTYVEEFVPYSPRRKRLRSSSSTSYIATTIATKLERSYPLRRAKIFQSRLSSGHPSCVKSLRSSYVSGNFKLKMPREFCNDHFSKEKLTIVLEDEEGSIYDTKYLGESVALSGEWKSFVVNHELDDGDALVLELIQPRRLKVYIFRVPNGGSEAKVDKIKKASGDEDMVDEDAEQITRPRKKRTRRKL
ncbi:hypothetical protein MKX01_022104 [Papaver californicum]|nr:hypothetical protein MKX01_022104 [Papaver californicum]